MKRAQDIKSVSVVPVFITLIAILLFIGPPARANLVPLQVNMAIYRDNFQDFLEPLPQSLQSTDEFGLGIPYNYMEDIYLDSAIGHSGSTSGDPETGDPQIYQHLYGYSLPETDVSYAVSNEAGHGQTFLVTEDMANKRIGKKVKVYSDINLDGSLLLVKADEEGTFEGLNATFEILLVRETEKETSKGIKIKTKKVLKGKVQLIGKKNGKVRIKTRGKIKKKYFRDTIIATDNLFQIDFNDVTIPYKTRVKVGQPYVIKTYISSNVVTNGEGTGAEVDFAPGEPILPVYEENNQVPEPATIGLLLFGGLSALQRKTHMIRWLQRRKHG
jgi:hypothetical protein